MFNIGGLLGRAWNILWRYKVLWVFALLLALSGGAANSVGGGGGGGGARGSSRFNLPSSGNWFDQNGGFQFGGANQPQWLTDLGTWVNQNIVPRFATTEMAVRTVIGIIVILIAFGLLISLLLALVRYPTETAVMRMVDGYEQSGTTLKFKEGWRLGWTGRAWRLFLVDLLIGGPAFAIVVLLLGTVGLLVWGVVQNSSANLSPAAVIALVFVGLFFLVFGLLMALVSLLRQYVARYTTLEGMNVGDSFKHGWQMFKREFWHTVLLGLVLVGLGIAVGFAMVIAFFVLIPAYAVLAVPGAVVAAIPGALAYALASLSAPVALAIIIGVLVAIPFFFVIVFAPLALLSGMFAVFISNVWTLAFRKLHPAGGPPPIMSEVPPALTSEVPPPL